MGKVIPNLGEHGMVTNLRSLSLAVNIPAFFCALGVSGLVIAATVAFYQGKNQITEQAATQLDMVITSRQANLKAYTDTIFADLNVMASNPFVHQGMARIDAAFDAMGADASKIITQNYITSNPYKLGERHKLDQSSANTPYDQIHGEYQPWFRDILEQKGFYDLFLVDPDMNVIYTAYK